MFYAISRHYVNLFGLILNNGGLTITSNGLLKTCTTWVSSFDLDCANRWTMASFWSGVVLAELYPPVNKHRPSQIGVGRLVSTKNWWFSGSMLIYQGVSPVTEVTKCVWQSLTVTKGSRSRFQQIPAQESSGCSWGTHWWCIVWILDQPAQLLKCPKGAYISRVTTIS